MAGRKVICKKLGREAEGLENAPFAGELGLEIFNSISREAWSDWSENMMIKIINEYRLNLAEKDQYDVLLKQMRAYLNLDSDSTVLEVENAERGRG